MVFNHYLSEKYRDAEFIFITQFYESHVTKFIDLYQKNPNRVFITNSNTFRNFILKRYPYAHILLYKKGMFDPLPCEKSCHTYIINEGEDLNKAITEILRFIPSKVIFIEKEVCAYDFHGEYSEVELICDAYGVEYQRTSPILNYILNENRNSNDGLIRTDD